MSHIQGLNIVHDFITSEQESTYIKLLDEMIWDTSISRRVIHFGFLYNYHNLNKNQKVNEIPEWLKQLFYKCKPYLLSKIPDNFDETKLMVIVNEYLPGQGIAPHCDNPRLFGEWVICIVLNSGCNMLFTNNNTSYTIYIPNKTLYEMSGDSRYKYKHSISKLKYDVIDDTINDKTNDIINGTKIKRDRRISITFRYML